MRLFKYYIAIIFVAALTACDVEYYDSPNQAAVVPTPGILNRVQKQLMVDTRDEWFSGRQALLWVQYWGQVNYTEEDRYQYRETVNEASWFDFYLHAEDLKAIIDFNTNEATMGDMAAYGPNENQIAASRIMLAYIFSKAVDVWGDMPYYSYGSDDPDFQALDLVENNQTYPAYASQSKIYEDILKELDEAEAQITGDFVMEGDNFFDGDAAQWKKFANSLRLRIANRIKGVNPTLANQHIADASTNVMTSNDDNAGVTFTADNNANTAPMYAAFYIDNRLDFAPAHTFVELLKGERGPFGADPRIDAMVADNAEGQKVGIPAGASRDVVGEFEWESLPGDGILDPKYKELYMEYAEVCFLLSENNAWDQTWYERGVEASMQKWGVAQADIDAYLATLPAATMETVLTQKYIALYMQPYEAWAEYRRTGYPNTLVMPGGSYDVVVPRGDGTTTTWSYDFDPLEDLTDLPDRVRYPLLEQNLNGDNRAAAANAIGGDEMDTELWWQ
ncbi:SusD/RagB family nutrient-binding outer membrane lipoprotein [Carboxylicivirga sp. RSCT41]|uniref:SusD/RagB family nutrient-binding outer membrane lipoprotein n=1 Tax=Carboxylicivirga agarovorans TaxID=3417570 RepID=UPI003D336C50